MVDGPFSDIFASRSGYLAERWGQYLPIYDTEIAPFLAMWRPVRLLELGVAGGSSLQIWESLFPPGSEVVGMDDDHSLDTLVLGPSVKVVVADATNAGAVSAAIGNSTFNIIIDNAFRRSSDVIETFQAQFDRVRPGGLYIIEDLQAAYRANRRGGYREAGSSIEFLKSLVDTSNADHYSAVANVPLDVREAAAALKSKIKRITFYDSVAVIERLSEAKTTPYPRVASGTRDRSPNSNSAKIATLDSVPEYSNEDVAQGRVTLRQAARLLLTMHDTFGGNVEGHHQAGGGQLVTRVTPFTLSGPEDETQRLERLSRIFDGTSFLSAPLRFAQLHEVDVDLHRGSCITKDGFLIEETALFSTTALAASRSHLGKDRLPATIAEPVLHCFHRSSPAYGHFVLDGLVTLERARDAMLASGVKILVPPYMPSWALDAIKSLGFGDQSILRATGDAIRCLKLILASSIGTSTTFRPDPDLCAGVCRRLSTAEGGRRMIYLSRANQTSYSQRRLINEDALQAFLRTRGFEILEPGNMTLQAQAAAFAEAAIIVGAHGSSFGNLIFAAPGALVVDLMPADWVGYWVADPPAERWLLNLTTTLNLDYRVLLCHSRLVRELPEDDQSGLQQFRMESTVDLDALGRVLNGQTEVTTSSQVTDFTLALLCSPALAPLFRLPDRAGTFSAWWGHVPFSAWLAKVTRPRRIVELGSHAGVSYFSFCQAVIAEALSCECHAVDTWQGDVHAGQYDEFVYEDFVRFNEDHYKHFSTMHRKTFDEALHDFDDASIDILHIDGLHTYDVVRHDFETWLPKMSRRGIVLFHDAVERREDFGVWQLWDELSVCYPSFLFTHSHGLGVLAVGADEPRAVLDLCAANPGTSALIRTRFGAIGDRWYWEAHYDQLAREAQKASGGGPHGMVPNETFLIANRNELQARLTAMESSAMWRATGPIRAASARFPSIARFGRKAAKILYWAFTGQIRRRRS